MALLSLQNVTLRHNNPGDPPLLDGVSLQIERGERVCLLGRNGVGKSSLLRLLGGEGTLAGGTILTQNGARLARLPQEVPGDAEGTVFEVVAAGWPDDATTPLETHVVDTIISRLKLEPDAPFSTLSGGLKRRAWLGRTLVGEPDLLLLDEPTNHLDIDSITWLEEFLLRYVSTLLFVTHDRTFLRKLATRIVEIDRGQLLSWACDYDTYLVRKEAALEVELKRARPLRQKAGQEEVWIRRGVEARRTKSQSRISALQRMREERSRTARTSRPGQPAASRTRDVRDVSSPKRNTSAFPIPVGPSSATFRHSSCAATRSASSAPTARARPHCCACCWDNWSPQREWCDLARGLQVAYFDQMRAQLDDEISVSRTCAATTRR